MKPLVAAVAVLVVLAATACAPSEQSLEEFADPQPTETGWQIYNFTDSRYQLHIENASPETDVELLLTNCPTRGPGGSVSGSEGLDRYTPFPLSVFRSGECGGFATRLLDEALNPPLNPIGGRLRATDEKGDVHVDVALGAATGISYYLTNTPTPVIADLTGM